MKCGIELDADIDDINFEALLKAYQEKGLIAINSDDLSEQFMRDVNNDIQLLSQIKQQWFSDGFGRDPKIEHLKKLLQSWLADKPKRKIIIYSEFGDTVNYLSHQLKNEFRVFKYTSKQANKSNKKTFRENFDARLVKDEQKNDYDILIATDAISEGFNLHRAGIIFNYDIPYNPTRVIQRAGRINRINIKVFDRLYIYNFFPTATGEDETRIRQITTLKFDMMNALLGEDTLVLTDETELESFFSEQYQRELAAQEQRSWDVDYLNLLSRLKTHQPDIVHQARGLPKRCRVRRTAQKEKPGVLIFGRKGNDYKFKLGRHEEQLSIFAESALKLFTAEVSEKPEKVSADFEAIYQRLKASLFRRKLQLSADKGKREALAKVEIFRNTLASEKDYLDDLLLVMRSLDSLPGYHLKLIRGLDPNQAESAVKNLKQELPHHYLSAMLEAARKIEQGDETIILAEELI